MGEPTLSCLLNLLFVATFYFARAQNNQCGSIGNSNAENELSVQTERRFYLNTANPALCNGNITSWRVCYYGPSSVDQDQRISYSSTFAIYRRMGSGEDEQYERVSNTLRAVVTTSNLAGNDVVDGEVQQGGFTCYNDTNDIDTPIPVQTGDLVGACIFDPEDGGSFFNRFTRLQLDNVGTVSGESLMGMSDSGCTVDTLPSSVQTSDLSTSNDRRLHIYANIVSNVISTTQPPTTQPPTMQRPTTLPTTNVDLTTGSSSATTAPPTEVQGSTTVPPVETEDVTGGILPTQPPPSGSESPAATIIGVVVCILLLLVVGVAIVVVVIYVMKRRLNGGTYSTAKFEKAQGINNIMYGNGLTADQHANGLEASMYEVPVSTTLQSRYIAPDTELSTSLYADPDAYEYATTGPNEELSASFEHYYSPLDEVTISYAQLLQKNKEDDIYGNVDEFLQPASEENELYAQLKSSGIRNIPRSLVKIEEHLGSGQFGSVNKGSWRNGAQSVPVALKILKAGSSDIDKTKFLQEAAIMAQFRHQNVVTLYGVITKSEPLMLVVELIQKGDLRNYLHTLRPDPGELAVISLRNLLLSFSQQVALGMHYLSSKGFVHRDLAARNILVSKDNVCKVADFGMSRDLADENYYVSHGGKIPVKWTAPEAIHYKKYSTASDVWSYGCLLYEIWSLGYKPFDGVTNNKVIQLVDSGSRLAPPPGCPKMIYELMISCWNPHPVRRPSFREHLLKLLSKQEEVLSIPQEDLDTHNLAGVLGSQLECGEGMYQELRNRYISGNDDDYQEVDTLN